MITSTNILREARVGMTGGCSMSTSGGSMGASGGCGQSWNINMRRGLTLAGALPTVWWRFWRWCFPCGSRCVKCMWLFDRSRLRMVMEQGGGRRMDLAQKIMLFPMRKELRWSGVDWQLWRTVMDGNVDGGGVFLLILLFFYFWLLLLLLFLYLFLVFFLSLLSRLLIFFFLMLFKLLFFLYFLLLFLYLYCNCCWCWSSRNFVCFCNCCGCLCCHIKLCH